MPLSPCRVVFNTINILHFRVKIRLKIQTFSDASFWMAFLETLAHPGAKTLDFGIPLAPSWAPHDTPNRPSGAKNTPKKHKPMLPRTTLETISFQKRFRSAPGHYVGRFLMDFGIDVDGFGHHFQWILVASLQQHLQNVKAAWHETK